MYISRVSGTLLPVNIYNNYVNSVMKTCSILYMLNKISFLHLHPMKCKFINKRHVYIYVDVYSHSSWKNKIILDKLV